MCVDHIKIKVGEAVIRAIDVVRKHVSIVVFTPLSALTIVGVLPANLHARIRGSPISLAVWVRIDPWGGLESWFFEGIEDCGPLLIA